MPSASFGGPAEPWCDAARAVSEVPAQVRLPALGIAALQDAAPHPPQPAARGSRNPSFACPDQLPVLSLLIRLRSELARPENEKDSKATQHVNTTAHATAFNALLQNEILMQHSAVAAFAKQLQAGLSCAATQIAHLGTWASHMERSVIPISDAQRVGGIITARLQDCDCLGEQLAALQGHVETVAHLVALLGVDADWGSASLAPHHGDLRVSYRQLAQACIWGCVDDHALLLWLSDCYSQARHVLQGITTACTSSRSGNSTVGGASQPGPAPASVGGQWKPPDQFRRSTTKFWVRMKDVPRLRVALLRHLPLLVLGRREGHQVLECMRRLVNPPQPPCVAAPTTPPPLQQDIPSTEGAGAASESYAVRASTAISSVYFDAPCCGGITGAARQPTAMRLWPFAPHEPTETAVLLQPLPVYHSRLRRDDGAALVRVRWYGPEPEPVTGRVFVEQKLHRDAWTGKFSVKERAQVEVSALPGLLAGMPTDQALPTPTPSMTADGSVITPNTPGGGLDRQQAFLTEVQTFLARLGQTPVLRTSYQRFAFQRADTNAVRISLDMQVCMRRETGLPGMALNTKGTLHMRNGSTHGNPLAAPDIVSFPYAILEVKLQDGDSCPDWVLACRMSGLLAEVPKFSKFLHGMALIYPAAVRATPSWFVPTDGADSPPSSQQPARTSMMATDPLESPARKAPSDGSDSESSSGSPADSAKSDACMAGGSGRAACGDLPTAGAHTRSISAAQLHLRRGGVPPRSLSGEARGPAMTPATIEEVAAALAADTKDAVRDWMFPKEITPEHWYDARPTGLGWVDLGDPACAACAAAAVLPTAPPIASRPRHACDLGRAWDVACTWVVPPSSWCGTAQSDPAQASPAGLPAACNDRGSREVQETATLEWVDSVTDEQEMVVAAVGVEAGAAALSCDDQPRSTPVELSFNPDGGAATTDVACSTPTLKPLGRSVSLPARSLTALRQHHGMPGCVPPCAMVSAAHTPTAAAPGPTVTLHAPRTGLTPAPALPGVGAVTAQATSGAATLQKGEMACAMPQGVSTHGAHGLPGRPASPLPRLVLSKPTLPAPGESLGSAVSSSSPGLPAAPPRLWRAAGALRRALRALRLARSPSSGVGSPPMTPRRGAMARDVELAVPLRAVPVASPMVRSRIEPKTFFAAERTFLSWINLAVMLMFVALSLLATAASFARTGTQRVPNALPAPSSSSLPWGPNTTAAWGVGGDGAVAANPAPGGIPGTGVGVGGGVTAVLGSVLVPGGGQQVAAAESRPVGLYAMCGDQNPACRAGLISGLVIAPAALALIALALCVYRKRTAQILRRETVRYDDQRGPVILTVMLLVLLGVAYGLAFHSVLV